MGEHCKVDILSFSHAIEMNLKPLKFSVVQAKGIGYSHTSLDKELRFLHRPALSIFISLPGDVGQTMCAVRQAPQNSSLAFVLNERMHLINCSKCCSTTKRLDKLNVQRCWLHLYLQL